VPPEAAEDLTFSVLIQIDQDFDGIPNSRDLCPASDLRPSVVINQCDSGVPNTLLTTGCTIFDLIVDCANKTLKNHGAFVSCVTHLTNDLKNKRTITGAQKGAIQSCVTKIRIP